MAASVSVAPAAALAVAAVAQFTPVVAAMGFDPAFASPVNFAILIYLSVYTRREITTLRRESVEAARELARTAKGSEDRATRAAAEITRLAGEITGTRQNIDRALLEVVVASRAVHDKLRLLRAASDPRDDGDDTPPHGMPAVRPEDDAR